MNRADGNQRTSGAPPPGDSALLAALFAQAPIGLACWDADLRYRRVNDALAAMNGRSVREHLGRRVSEVLPELAPQLEQLFGEVLATGNAHRDLRITGETPAAPGVTRHWLASYFPVCDDEGRRIGIGATVVEITAERRARDRASRAERLSTAMDAHLRAVYSALPVGVGFVTPDLRYERVNEALAAINGFPVEAHIGRTVRELLGEHADQAEAMTREVIRREEPIEAELTMPSPAGPMPERFFAATYFPVFAPHEPPSGARLLGVGAVVRDVTEHRLAASERDRLLREALSARAQAEAAHVRAEASRQETESALADAEAQREAAEAARRRAAFLARVTRRMAASLDYAATLREVVSSAVPEIADWGVISVVEPDGHLRVLGFNHRDPGRTGLVATFAERYHPSSRSGVTRAIRSGEPVIARDVTPEQIADIASDEETSALALALGVRHYATWPIPSPDGTVIGALSFILGDSGRVFSPGDLQIGQTLATRAGLHLTNARLYSERVEIADTLQASLLPGELPEIPGVELAAAFVAAGRHNVVGGDFYDVFPSGPGAWTAVIGDVAGKGARAAAITATTRHTLRAAALVDSEPAHNLALLNRALLLSHTGQSELCSAICVRLTPDGDRLVARVAHAGHPPALVLRHDGTVHPVGGGRGPLAGVFADAHFAVIDVALGSGDLLLLYTDGVTEVSPSDTELGERELASTLRRARGRPARDVAEAVKESALRLQEGTPRDDIAVVAVRVPTPNT